MDQWKNDFLNLENELVSARKKLNDLIYEYQNKGQNVQEAAIYRDKLHYLEVELQYINNQLQLLKNAQNVNVQANMPVQNMAPVSVNMGMKAAPVQTTREARTTQDYEKMFGKNLMGIFASVLIFISLIIFATLILPHLTDTLKMLAMYIVSFAVITAGLLLYRRNKNNLFYIAIIGCGVGSLYLSLLLSNMYFKVFGDLALYLLILVWAVFIRYLTKIKHYVFTIIGQAGILIASILGTALCVFEADPQKFLVLSIFYFISAVVFSNVGRSHLLPLLHSGINEILGDNTDEKDENSQTNLLEQPCYEQNLCTHIFKTLNMIVYVIGFAALEHSVYRYSSDSGPSAVIIFNVFLYMTYLLLEFFFSYREKCRDGLAFQILTMINTFLLVCLFNEMELFTEEWSYAFLYLAGLAALIYVEKKAARHITFSQIFCLIYVFLGCVFNPWMREHLYAYLTVVPIMLYGKRKKENIYLGAGVVYLACISTLNYEGIEHLIMLTVLYAVFLYISRKTDQTWFKAAGYLAIYFATLILIDQISFRLMKDYNDVYQNAIRFVSTKSKLITFFVLSVIHLVLNKLEYFGKEKNTEIMMLGINALLMFAGCVFMDISDELVWKLPVILLTILLFFINSKRLLPRHKYAGYYIALKYTALMLCILGSFDVVNYAVSICLLVFAIISIVAGFYKDMITFRLYGLILSMISIFKLLMIDIKYDSTIESAVSFFVSGVLCFVISFIYNRIDGKLRGK